MTQVWPLAGGLAWDWPDFDEDDYPCLDEESCGAVCLGDCYAAQD